MEKPDRTLLAHIFYIPVKAKKQKRNRVYDTPRKRVVTEMLKHGIEVPDEFDKWTDIDAPKGKVFCANECHVLMADGSYKNHLEDLKSGLSDCRYPEDCDTCNGF